MYSKSLFTALPLLALGLLAGLPTASAALLVPPFRHSSDASYGIWNVFTDAYTAPASIGMEGEGNAADLESSASFAGMLYQTGSSTGFLTGGGNIYSFAEATGFTITDANSYAAQTVILQLGTIGTLPDYTSVFLRVGDVDYAPTYTETLASAPSGGMGGTTVDWAAQWDLSAIGGATAYSVIFMASGSSMSLDYVSLDSSGGTSPVNLIAVPEPGTGVLGFACVGSLILLRRRWRR